jgi:hypothetical protein
LAEEYIPPDSGDVKDAVMQIVTAKPAVVLNTLSGTDNHAFFKALSESGITPGAVPVMSFKVAENELRALDLRRTAAGNYTCRGYFQSIDSPENKIFVDAFKEKFGLQRVTDDSMEAAYSAVYLWAQAATEAGTLDVNEIRKTIKSQSLNAPEGLIYVDPRTQHLWKSVRIGKIREDGQFDIVWSSEKPIRPLPYPAYWAKSEWDKFTQGLYLMWNRHWSNPGISEESAAKKMSQEIALLEALAGRPEVVSAVEAANRTNSLLNQDEFKQLDKNWRVLKETDSFIARMLNNDCSMALMQFQEANPQFKEIFITDAIGLNVAMTEKTTDYYQADEAWWTEAYNSGKGRVYHGKLEYDRSAETWGIPVYVPIYSPQAVVVGIIKAFLSAEELTGR